MKLAPPAIRDELLDRHHHRHVRLFRIARRDGVVIRLTEHSSPIKVDGEIYEPTNSVLASATETKAGLGEASFEARGALSSDLITNADLRAGRYRGAEVLEGTFDWEFPWLGALSMHRQFVFEVSFDDASWTAQSGGVTRLLNARVGKRFETSCDEPLGGPLCRVDVVPLSNYFVRVSAVTDQRTFTVDPLSPSRDSGWFAYGETTWRKGSNKDVPGRCLSWDATTRQVQLEEDAPHPIAIGDRIDLIVGCDHLGSTCKLKFDNLDNFQGFPEMPTTDDVVAPVAT